jgi:hypothetical protein
MGQHRQTARVSGDKALLKRDILEDAMVHFHRDDMADGPSEEDIRLVAEEYESEGLTAAPGSDLLTDAAADLRTAMATEYAAHRASHDA